MGVHEDRSEIFLHVCPTDIVRPHAAQLMIDTLCQSILQNMDGLVRIYWPFVRQFFKIKNRLKHTDKETALNFKLLLGEYIKAQCSSYSIIFRFLRFFEKREDP